MKRAGIVDRMRIVMTDGVLHSSLYLANVSMLLLVLDVVMSSLWRRATG